jgi:hypothetical protein
MENNFTDLWNSTKTAETGNKEFTQIPEGTYIATIEDAKYNMSEVPNKVEFTLKITGESNGNDCTVVNRKLWKNYRVDDIGLPWLKKDLSTLGLNLDSIQTVEQLAGGIGSLVKSTVEVAVNSTASKKDPSKMFTNAYFNKLLDRAPNPELNF